MSMAELESWLLPLGLLVAAGLLGYLAKYFLVQRVARLAAHTATDLDDLVIASARRHVPVWFLLGGVGLAAQAAPIGEDHVRLVSRLAAALFFLSLSFAAAGLIGGLVDRTARGAGGAFAATSLSRNVLRAAVLGIGTLLVLSNLGVEITPLLTALGVGSLAVALALQSTLSNLFAGLHISVAKPVRVGDFVELEGGVQGFVMDIGWRATKVRELSNNVIVVPNARLSEMVLKNYALPEPEQSVVVQVGVGYGSNLKHVQRVTCEVAREVLAEVEGAVSSFEPFIRYHTFGDSAICFSVILRVKQFTDRYLVTHEFLMRLKDRYDREHIEIPFPQRVLHGAFELKRPSRDPVLVAGDVHPERVRR
jgi:small-conductance mechanosensitive channel